MKLSANTMCFQQVLELEKLGCKLHVGDTYLEGVEADLLFRTPGMHPGNPAIEALRSRFNVAPLHLIATDGYAHHMRDVLEAMDEETFDIYLRYHFATCERPDLLGLSNHTLDIFRKQ